jgi:hypothetical protein
MARCAEGLDSIWSRVTMPTPVGVLGDRVDR